MLYPLSPYVVLGVRVQCLHEYVFVCIMACIVPPPYTKVKTELISSVIIRGGAIKNKFRLWCCYSIISHLY